MCIARPVETATYPDGRSSSRYQQIHGGAAVLGAQLTVVRSADGVQLGVIGTRFVEVKPVNAVLLSEADARRAVARTLGGHGRWQQELRLDPATRRLFYEVRSARRGSMPVRWLDAASGRIIRAFDL